MAFNFRLVHFAVILLFSESKRSSISENVAFYSEKNDIRVTRQGVPSLQTKRSNWYDDNVSDSVLGTLFNEAEIREKRRNWLNDNGLNSERNIKRNESPKRSKRSDWSEYNALDREHNIIHKATTRTKRSDLLDGNKLYRERSITRHDAEQRTKRSFGWFDETTCRDGNSCQSFYHLCHCDDLCQLKDDCCWDASHNKSVSQADFPKMSCVHIEGDTLSWVVSGCPDAYINQDIKAKCTRKSPSNPNDPQIYLPVLEELTNTVYQNRYCAECNGATDVIQFNISVQGFNKGCKRPDTSSPIDVLKYYLEVNSSCSIEFIKEGLLDLRTCYTDLIRTCTNTSDSTLKNNCETGPLDPVFVSGETGMASYRNYYCYKCSEYYPSHAASCYPSSSLSEVSLKVVVDTSYLTDADGTKVTSACGEGRIYDRAYDKCRTINCDGRLVYNDGKCEDMYTSIANVAYNASLLYFYVGDFTTNEDVEWNVHDAILDELWNMLLHVDNTKMKVHPGYMPESKCAYVEVSFDVV